MQAGEWIVLAINPGSTSTKIAVYANDRVELVRNLSHSDSEMEPFRGRPILDQLEFRQSRIELELSNAGYPLEQLQAVVGRGGLMRPVASGAYQVNEAMLEDLRSTRYGEHASNLGAFLAQAMARKAGAEAFIVDPVSVDEFIEPARVSGSALAGRPCMSHALNTKAVAKRYARERGRTYPELRLVVAHLGSGISVSAHEGGKMIDVNNAGQEGTFSMERAGGLQTQKVIQLCFSGKYTEPQLWNLMSREGGVYSYLGTKDLREVERRIAAGDGQAALIFDAMVYQTAKDIGAMATVLNGRVDAVLLTGGMAHSQKLVQQLCAAIQWIAPVTVYPGEDELQALAEGALRVLRGEEQARELKQG
ncbi:MAG: butyrate kinase [Terracidiphilus sp.]|jgi:butyrate kinase